MYDRRPVVRSTNYNHNNIIIIYCSPCTLCSYAPSCQEKHYPERVLHPRFSVVSRRWRRTSVGSAVAAFILVKKKEPGTVYYIRAQTYYHLRRAQQHICCCHTAQRRLLASCHYRFCFISTTRTLIQCPTNRSTIRTNITMTSTNTGLYKNGIVFTLTVSRLRSGRRQCKIILKKN